jgi:hypothetical protein
MAEQHNYPPIGQVSRYQKARTLLDGVARAAIKEQKAVGRTLREPAALYDVSHQTLSNTASDDLNAQSA